MSVNVSAYRRLNFQRCRAFRARAIIAAGTMVLVASGAGTGASAQAQPLRPAERTVNGCVLQPQTTCVNATLTAQQFGQDQLWSSDFRGTNFTSSTMTGTNFVRANLPDVSMVLTQHKSSEFREANLTSANFNTATLDAVGLLAVIAPRSTYTEANLLTVRGLGGDFTGADFSRASLVNSRFERANFSGANFNGALISGVYMLRAEAPQASFAKARIDDGSNFTAANLVGADLSEAQITNSTFDEAVLTTASLAGAQILNSSFTAADLPGISLRAARGTEVEFVNADMTAADFFLANFSIENPDRQRRNDFSRANLAGASFDSADLSGAWFAGANLQRANFTSADLNGTVFYGADLRGAKIPSYNFDARGRPKFSCDRNTKTDGRLRERLRGHCRGWHATIYLQAK